MMKLKRVLVSILLLSLTSWVHAQQHTPHEQISAQNVSRVKLTFQFQTGDLNQGFRDKGHSLQATSVYGYGKLFVSSSSNLVIAVDAGSGEEIWHFDPILDRELDYSESASRGVSLWQGEADECPVRVFIGTLSSKLYALDANSGEPCLSFGEQGVIDLSQGIANFRPGDYSVTSPVAVMSDRVIVGSAIGDNGAAELENGIVRA